MTILECGHEATPQKPGAGGTGYASFPDGSKACYGCSDALAKMHGAAGTLTFAYLTQEAPGRIASDGSGCSLATWPGGYLGSGRVLKRTRRVTPTGGRYTELTGRARIMGRDYAFRGPGESGTYVRLRALKSRSQGVGGRT